MYNQNRQESKKKERGEYHDRRKKNVVKRNYRRPEASGSEIIGTDAYRS